MVTTARPAAGAQEAGHWTERAAALLAVFMHAAALDDKSMRNVLAWTSRHEYQVPRDILKQHDAALAVDLVFRDFGGDGRLS